MIRWWFLFQDIGPTGPTHWTDPEQTWVSNSSIAIYWTGSVRSHLILDGFLSSLFVGRFWKIWYSFCFIFQKPSSWFFVCLIVEFFLKDFDGTFCCLVEWLSICATFQSETAACRERVQIWEWGWSDRVCRQRHFSRERPNFHMRMNDNDHNFLWA